MVNFAEKLRTTAVERWAGKYLDYKRLKAAINRKVQQLDDLPDYDPTAVDAETAKFLALCANEAGGVLKDPSVAASVAYSASAGPAARGSMEPGSLYAFLTRDGDLEFVRILVDEIKKVDAFYVRKCDEYERRLELLEEQVERHGQHAAALGMVHDSDSDEDGVVAPHTCMENATAVAAERALPFLRGIFTQRPYSQLPASEEEAHRSERPRSRHDATASAMGDAPPTRSSALAGLRRPLVAPREGITSAAAAGSSSEAGARGGTSSATGVEARTNMGMGGLPRRAHASSPASSSDEEAGGEGYVGRRQGVTSSARSRSSGGSSSGGSSGARTAAAGAGARADSAFASTGLGMLKPTVRGVRGGVAGAEGHDEFEVDSSVGPGSAGGAATLWELTDEGGDLQQPTSSTSSSNALPGRARGGLAHPSGQGSAAPGSLPSSSAAVTRRKDTRIGRRMPSSPPPGTTAHGGTGARRVAGPVLPGADRWHTQDQARSAAGFESNDSATDPSDQDSAVASLPAGAGREMTTVRETGSTVASASTKQTQVVAAVLRATAPRSADSTDSGGSAAPAEVGVGPQKRRSRRHPADDYDMRAHGQGNLDGVTVPVPVGTRLGSSSRIPVGAAARNSRQLLTGAPDSDFEDDPDANGVAQVPTPPIIPSTTSSVASSGNAIGGAGAGSNSAALANSAAAAAAAAAAAVMVGGPGSAVGVTASPRLSGVEILAAHPSSQFHAAQPVPTTTTTTTTATTSSSASSSSLQLYHSTQHHQQPTLSTGAHPGTLVAGGADVGALLPSPHQVTLGAHSLKRAFLDLYRSMVLLHNYAVLNYTGFVKILKKHDKYTGLSLTRQALPMLHRCPFYSADRLRTLTLRLERDFAEHFADGNLNLARAVLLVRHRPPTNWGEFHLGLRLGLGVMLLLWVAWDCVVDAELRPASPEASMWIHATLPIWRGLGCLVLMLWCWGLNLYVWGESRINYHYLFELNPDRTMDHQTVFRKAGVLSACFCACFLLFYKVVRGEVLFHGIASAGYVPLFMSLLLLQQFVWPWRADVMRALRDVVLSPFAPVSFFSAFLGDVLTSMVKVLIDMTYTMCFFVSGDFLNRDGATQCADAFWFKQVATPLICALPLWWRFHQNMRRYHDTHRRTPFIPNALKYALSHSVVLFGVFHPDFKSATTGFSLYQTLWLASLATSTLYTFSWDVLMDWGLGSREHGYLRERLMFRKRPLYYCAIIADFFMRFLWTLTLLPSRAGLLELFISIDPGLAAAEIWRRCMWSMFRLEHEHLANTEGYRRVDFVPQHFDPPVHKPAHARNKSAWSIISEVLVLTAIVVSLGVLAVVSA